MSETLTSNGFPYCIQNVTLGNDIPDTDNLAIWIEEGFGNVIFIIETKNQIPEKFGRDYVRSIQSEDFIVNAQKQVKKIGNYLASPNFIKLLKQRFPKEVYSQEVHAINFIVVTAQNMGLFLKNHEVVTVDYQTFDCIVESFKGDILKILKLLKIDEMKNVAKQHSEVAQREFSIGEYQITIPVIGIKNLVKFG